MPNIGTKSDRNRSMMLMSTIVVSCKNSIRQNSRIILFLNTNMYFMGCQTTRQGPKNIEGEFIRPVTFVSSNDIPTKTDSIF